MPFLVIIVVLVIRGRGLPLRGSITDRLPRVGTGRIRPAVVVVVAAASLLWIAFGASKDWYAPTIVSATFAIVGLSVVVLTGYTGQLSLAQFALAGIGSFSAAKLVADHGWRFEPALVVGVLVAAAIGFLFGLPALRTRGVNLAVVTFGLGFAVHQLVFSNTAYTEPARVQPTDLSLFGWPIDPIGHARNYAVVCVAFLILAALAVANLRRGRTGRRLLAVRTNERAAAAIGVNVFEAKLYGFTLSAGIAGLGGVLLRVRVRRDPLRPRLPAGRLDQRAGADRDRQRRLRHRPAAGLAARLERPGHADVVGRPHQRRARGLLDLAAVPPDRHRNPAPGRADPQPERRRRAARRPHPPRSGSGSRGCGQAAPEPLPKSRADARSPRAPSRSPG